ncbi:MAG TPA: glycosyltransferase family 39 protein, partial [Candidatus Limnocylindrales bacterium]|nr:glycosyltransferase family 39 protein [Candidatus Limnocylindrales bacterium]
MILSVRNRVRSFGFDLTDRRFEILAYGAILVVAAFLRLGNLAARGTWDADQGHDMLVLRALVLDGRLPLLGPPTSIGDFHHGVLYYLLLAPAAAVSRADPIAVTTWIALGGVVAVAVTGWLARSIAGPIAGLIAALVLAVSASAVEESIFIWNPNLIALSSSIALAAAWRAWTGGRARWWLVAGAAAVVTMQCHVLGVILSPVIGGLLVADMRRRRRVGDRRGASAVGRAAFGWLGIALLSYVPLAIHEIGNDASELRAAIAFVTGGGGPASVALAARLPIVGLRVVGWPLGGLITAAPMATVLAAALVAGMAIWRGWLAGRRFAETPDERTAVRWLALGLAWTIVALAVGAASLATVVPGLPNDHYHAFADPMVVILVAVGLARLLARPTRGASPVAAVGAAALIVALVGWNLASQPPSKASDGGW